jgi:hypothetical protein
MGEKEFFKLLDEAGAVRLRFRVKSAGGALAFFAVQLEALIDGEWKVVVRYDNAHGYVHRDVMARSGRQLSKDVLLHDLASAITFAEQDLSDRWEWYIARFLGRGRRGGLR